MLSGAEGKLISDCWAYCGPHFKGTHVTYFAVTAISLGQGQVTDVYLRLLDGEPLNKVIAIRGGSLVPVADVIDRIRGGDTVYLGKLDPRDGMTSIGSKLQVQDGEFSQLVSEPPDALRQLPRM
jgi:hypothetical protein